MSQKVRKQVEEIFGWMMAMGGYGGPRYRGVERSRLAGYFVATAYNLVRMANLALYERFGPFGRYDLPRVQSTPRV